MLNHTAVEYACWNLPVTDPPKIVDGYMVIPNTPGWGTDLNEKELAKHPWRG